MQDVPIQLQPRPKADSRTFDWSRQRTQRHRRGTATWGKVLGRLGLTERGEMWTPGSRDTVRSWTRPMVQPTLMSCGGCESSVPWAWGRYSLGGEMGSWGPAPPFSKPRTASSILEDGRRDRVPLAMHAKCVAPTRDNMHTDTPCARSQARRRRVYGLPWALKLRVAGWTPKAG